MNELIDTWDVGGNVPTIDQIRRLQESMTSGVSAGLMVVPDMKTSHHFSGRMYCRKVWRPKGTLIVGKVHKVDHLFICAEGEIIAWSETGMRHMKAGDVIESKAGTKRVTLALTDAIGITVHHTDKTDLDDIEAELIEPDHTALFDARNEVKALAIEGETS